MQNLFRTDSEIPRWLGVTLAATPFVLCIFLYFYGVAKRRAENPDDKIMPTMSEMIYKMKEMTFPIKAEEDEMDWETEIRLSEQYPFWKDVWASSKRFAYALAIIVLVGVPLGLTIGTFPIFRSFLNPYLTFFDKTTTFVLLPILFVIWGKLSIQPSGDSFKVALIVLSVLPTITLYTALEALKVPSQLKHKAQSLGATELEVAWRAVFPQIWPGVLDTIRSNFKAMATMLIGAEFIAAAAGMGYRISTSMRSMSMDTILPYSLIMMITFFLLDLIVERLSRRLYPWYYQQ